MAIKVGDSLPTATFMEKTADGIGPVASDELFGGKKVVVFAVPGAYTPTCSAKHVPSFIANADKLKAKGVDEIACVSVNDAFVMEAWGKDQGVAGEIRMLADGAALFTKAVGQDLDLTERGLGVRSKRYAMIVEDGKVTELMVEEAPGEMSVSSAESVLEKL